MEIGFIPYQVTVPSNSDGIFLITKWCEMQFGQPAFAFNKLGIDGKWIRYTTKSMAKNIAIYNFLNEDDATLFRLTWL